MNNKIKIKIKINKNKIKIINNNKYNRIKVRHIIVKNKYN